jgi:hypothetical protein
MPQQQLSGLPEITIEEWDGLAVPKEELQATLAYLAHKTGRAVRLKEPCEQLYYSSEAVMIYPYPLNAHVCADGGLPIKIDRQDHMLDARQKLYDGRSVRGPLLTDDNGIILAIVDHNCIVLQIALLNADNAAARLGFAYVVQKEIESLDSQVSDIAQKQNEAVNAELRTFFTAGFTSRLEDKRDELRGVEHEVEDAYYRIVDAEQRKPFLVAEIEALERATTSSQAKLIAQQTRALQELKEAGQYESIRCQPDGSVMARTGKIIIDYDSYTFPLGRYQVEIDRRGALKIRNLDDHPNTDYPHPHVATDYHPCLGNIAGDLAKLIGKLRVAEALQVIHQFLCSYNPANPYEKIGRFDPSGEYHDEDDDPCQDCDEKCSPYCIFECGSNDGQYNCRDCCNYRTDECYRECSHNEGYEYVHPCEGCSDEGSENCYLECPYNDTWQLRKPCTNCDQDCDESCQYKKMKEELDHAQSQSA